jgi:hypothetical protein
MKIPVTVYETYVDALSSDYVSNTLLITSSAAHFEQDEKGSWYIVYTI